MNAATIRPINYSLRLGWVADSAAASRDAADAHFGMVANVPAPSNGDAYTSPGLAGTGS
jgi:hypothetical protein